MSMVQDGIRAKYEPLSMGLACEMSLGYQWRCPKCNEELRTERSAETGWNTHYFTHDGRRHYKTRCNLDNLNQEKVHASQADSTTHH